MRKSVNQLIRRSKGLRRSTPAYIIATIGGGWAMVQGGLWAALAVFAVGMITAAAVEIWSRQ